MYKIVFLLCLAVGLTQAFDIKSINDTISKLCQGITTQPGPAAIQIDRMENLFHQNRQFIEQYLPRTTVYLTKQENKNSLKSGGENCQRALNDLKTLLLIDLQENQKPFQFLKQIIPLDI